jgi:hypothetical protein
LLRDDDAAVIERVSQGRGGITRSVDAKTIALSQIARIGFDLIGIPPVESDQPKHKEGYVHD